MGFIAGALSPKAHNDECHGERRGSWCSRAASAESAECVTAWCAGGRGARDAVAAGRGVGPTRGTLLGRGGDVDDRSSDLTDRERHGNHAGGRQPDVIVLHRRGRGACLRDTDAGDRGVLGGQQRGAGDAARGHVPAAERTLGVQLWGAHRWHPGLLGRGLRGSDAASGELSPGERRLSQCLRGGDERHAGLLGVNEAGEAIPPGGNVNPGECGGWAQFGLKTDHTLACWGQNDYGQATPPTGTFVQVSAGYLYTCGLRQRHPRLLGEQRGRANRAAPRDLTQVSAETSSAAVSGSAHTCGVRIDGTLACWGANYGGQATPPGGTFTQVIAGSEYTCGVGTDGTLACWGYVVSAPQPVGAFSRPQVSVGVGTSAHCKSTAPCRASGPTRAGQATAPAGDLHRGERGNHAHLRGADGRRGRVLGRQQRGAS